MLKKDCLEEKKMLKKRNGQSIHMYCQLRADMYLETTIQISLDRLGQMSLCYHRTTKRPAKEWKHSKGNTFVDHAENIVQLMHK